MDQARSLGMAALQEVTQILEPGSTAAAAELSMTELVDRTEIAFREQMKIAKSSEYPSRQRRIAFETVNGFFKALNEKAPLGGSTTSSANKNYLQQQQQPRITHFPSITSMAISDPCVRRSSVAVGEVSKAQSTASVHQKDAAQGGGITTTVSDRMNVSESSTVSKAGPQGHDNTEIKLSQDDLARRLLSTLHSCRPYLRPHVKELASRRTIPRSKIAFLNYARTALRLNRAPALEVWAHIETVTKAATMETQKKDAGPYHGNESTTTTTRHITEGSSYSANQERGNKDRPGRPSYDSPMQNHTRDESSGSLPRTTHGASSGSSSIASHSIREHNSQASSKGLPKECRPSAQTREGTGSSASQQIHSRLDSRTSDTQQSSRRRASDANILNDDMHANDIEVLSRRPSHPPVGRSKRDMSHIATPQGMSALSATSIEMKVMEDTPVTSCANAVIVGNPRGCVTVKFDDKPVSEKELQQIASRLHDCEPFWEIVAYVKVFQTNPVLYPTFQTSPGSRQEPPPPSRTAFWGRMNIHNAYMHQRKLVGKIDVKHSEWGLITDKKYETGETRLLFIMIPRDPPSKKRADGHIWPKGTFLQLTTIEKEQRKNIRIRLAQRKQESHDHGIWKGMCKILDLTCYVAEPNGPIKLEGITYDDEIYFGCVVYAKFRSPKLVYDILMEKTSPAPISFLTAEEGEIKAIGFASSIMVVLDSDHEPESGEEEELGKFIFSLTDASSMKLMSTPVRGINCKHFQVRIRFTITGLRGTYQLSNVSHSCTHARTHHSALT